MATTQATQLSDSLELPVSKDDQVAIDPEWHQELNKRRDILITELNQRSKYWVFILDRTSFSSTEELPENDDQHYPYYSGITSSGCLVILSRSIQDIIRQEYIYLLKIGAVGSSNLSLKGSFWQFYTEIGATDQELQKVGEWLETILFHPPFDVEDNIWNGTSVDRKQLISLSGVDLVEPDYLVDLWLENLLNNLKVPVKIYYSGQGKTSHVIDAISSNPFTSDQVVLADPIIDQLRSIKSPYEIGLIREACRISAEAHLNVMKSIGALFRNDQQQPVAIREHLINGLFTGYVLSHGCFRLAYPTIAGSGPNSTILHYNHTQQTPQKNRLIKSGEMVLLDAGGQFQGIDPSSSLGYCADITRTWPVNGRFTQSQAEVYQLVLDIQLACIDLVKPGNCMEQLQEKAKAILLTALSILGVIDKSKISDNRSLVINQFYMHYIGHWIGSRVHDCPSYEISHVKFRAGQTITVEPGIYFPKRIDPEVAPYLNLEIYQQYQGIGVRIEDVILVTDSGHEVLSAGVPKEIDQIQRAILS